MHSYISGHTFIKKRRKSGGVGEGRAWRCWRGLGGGEGERTEGGSKIFDDILGRGSEVFHQSS